jgi:4-hydroxybenzoate polyprenyltransferase
LGFVLVLFTNTATIWLSFGGLAGDLLPLVKRFFYPQVVLGAAFSCERDGLYCRDRQPAT